MNKNKILGIIALPLLIAGCASTQTEQTGQSSSMWGDSRIDRNLHTAATATAVPYNQAAQVKTQRRGNYIPPTPYRLNDQDHEKFSRIDARVQEHKQKIQENKSSQINTTNIPAGQTFQPAKSESPASTAAPSNAPATYTPSSATSS